MVILSEAKDHRMKPAEVIQAKDLSTDTLIRRAEKTRLKLVARS
jgi:hypothetical protein